MAAKKTTTSKAPRSKWYSDGVPATNPNPTHTHEYQKKAIRDLKESRIEQIAGIMRQFCDSKGNVLWTRKLRLALGKSWGLTDRQVRDLSNEAHRRVCEEVDDPESHRRNVGSVMLDGLAHCKANKDWKTAAVVSTVILKMADGPVKIEVSVETKQPTPADAARAVREMFTDRVENDESKSDESGASSEGDPESADSPADEPTPE